MKRRQFIGTAFGALAAGVVAAGERNALGAVGKSKLDAAAYRKERRYADLMFGKIAYVERGSGSVALFLHGFPLNSFQWRGAIERLASHRRCIAPDFMGLGYTQIPDGQSCIPDAQASMLADLLDSLGIVDVDLVANDSGGAVAQLFVTRYPKRVRTLLLTNCDVEPDSPPPALEPVLELSREGKFADQWLAPWLTDKALARSAKGIGGMTFSDPMQPTDEAIEYYFSPLLGSARKKAQLHAYAMGLSPNPLAGIEPALKKCAVPTRILWGTADDIFSKDSPAYLDRTMGNSRGVRRIEGAKLFWPEEHPDIVAEEARRLWGV